MWGRIFNFQKAYAVRRYITVDGLVLISSVSKILDELIISGELQESSKKSVLRVVCKLLYQWVME